MASHWLANTKAIIPVFFLFRVEKRFRYSITYHWIFLFHFFTQFIDFQIKLYTLFRMYYYLLIKLINSLAKVLPGTSLIHYYKKSCKLEGTLNIRSLHLCKTRQLKSWIGSNVLIVPVECSQPTEMKWKTKMIIVR